MNDEEQIAATAERIRARRTAEVAHRFEYHPPNSEAVENAHRLIRGLMGDAAQIVLLQVPDGREKALALTALEEAMFWANAGIARKQGEGQ